MAISWDRINTLLLLLVLFALLAVVGMLATGVRGGPLDPTGTPGPTMKTLQEVEPRTPISSLTFAITQPGSYYLTGNLTATGFNHGINVAADDVDIDLNGFTLTGGSTAGGIGIYSITALKDITVRNGTLRGWNSGISLPAVTGAVIEDVTVIGMGGFGVSVGANATIRDCAGRDNATETIKATDFAIVTGCNVADCVQATSTGILTDESSLVADNVVENCGSGITAGARSIVRGNAVAASRSSGIVVGSNTLVTGNVSTGSGTVGDGSGIAVTGVGHTIEGNTAAFNDIGINASASSVVIGNTAYENGAPGIADEYVLQTTTVAGPTLDGVSVDTATNPYANFAPQ